MKILLILTGMLLTCGLSGAMLSFAFRTPECFRRLGLHLGYAYTLLAFYGFYFLTHAALTSTVCTVVLPMLLAGGRFLAGRLGNPASHKADRDTAGSRLEKPRSRWGYPASISLVVVLLAAWPYLLTGWGNYWQSGNYDMEDGLNGRDAYVENLIFDSKTFDMGSEIGDKSWYDFAKVTGTLAKRARELDSYQTWYAGDGFRFQYSSQAFWSELFDERYGMDILLIQTLLNLVLMAIGIFYLSKDAFGLGAAAAATAALCSVCGTFYLTTFYNGHVGSLIYGSLIPAVLHVALVRSGAPRDLLYRLGLGGVTAAAIAFAYPHPLVVIGIPLAAYWTFMGKKFPAYAGKSWSYLRANPRILLLTGIALVLMAALLLTGLWEATEGYRIRQDGQYRAWGYARDWLIVPLYLGLILPPMEGTVFIGGLLDQNSYWALVAGSGGILGLLLYCFIRAKTPKHPRFLLIFGVCWAAEYLVFRFFIIDSYYLYKFVYTHQFVFVIGVVSFLSGNRSRFFGIIFAALTAVNLFTDLRLAQAIYNRPYNQHPERYQSLLSLDHNLLERSFVELTGGDAVAVRQTLKLNGVQRVLDPRFADYFIVPAGRESDITGAQFTETLGETSGLALKRAPALNYLMVRTWNEPEQYPADPILGGTVFRWMSHGKNAHLGIYIIRPSLTEELRGKFLRICFHKGPSAQQDIDVTVSTADKRILRKITLSSGVQCVWIPAEQAVAAEQPLVIHSGAKGKSLLPHDDRILLYRVFAVGWTDRVYDDQALALLNRGQPDIIKPAAGATADEAGRDIALRLGQGWSPYENFGGENFRWVGGPADLVIKGAGRDGTAQVAIELEPGPSHGPLPLEIEVTDSLGNLVVVSAAITGRNRIVLPLEYRAQQTSVYTLRTHSEGRRVPGESRMLNYRVFGVEVQ